jgi:hypothetical protein
MKPRIKRMGKVIPLRRDDEVTKDEHGRTIIVRRVTYSIPDPKGGVFSAIGYSILRPWSTETTDEG